MTIFLPTTWLTVGCVLAYPTLTPEPLTAPDPAMPSPLPTLRLPGPRVKGEVSVEEAMRERRAVREYAGTPLTLEEVSQLLWAAQGITTEWGERTVPSAGALYPLELYLVVGHVENLAVGVYQYVPQRHELVKIREEDVRGPLARAALGQTFVRECAIDLVITAVYERTTRRYGERGIRYVHMEAGHACQNISLQATALNLGTVAVGAFYDDRVRDIIGMPRNEVPLYLIPVGRET